jgi:hypothetical protein
MKHIKLYEEFVNEGYYSSSDKNRIKEFAIKVSDEIVAANKDNKKFNRAAVSYNKLNKYISSWGGANEMSVEEIRDEFDWKSLTYELGIN